MDILMRLESGKFALLPCQFRLISFELLFAIDFQLLKATAYCTAEKYDFDALLPLLRKHYVLLPYIAEDVLQVHLTDPATVNSPTWEGSSPSAQQQPEAYIFPTGSFVTWGATIGQSERLLRLLKKVEVNPGKITTEEFMYYENQEQ